jgi:hypothetical protein
VLFHILCYGSTVRRAYRWISIISTIKVGLILLLSKAAAKLLSKGSPLCIISLGSRNWLCRSRNNRESVWFKQIRHFKSAIWVKLSYEERKVKRGEIIRVRGKSSIRIDTGIDTIDICNTWLIPPSIDTGINTSGIEAEPGRKLPQVGRQLQCKHLLLFARRIGLSGLLPGELPLLS